MAELPTDIGSEAIRDVLWLFQAIAMSLVGLQDSKEYGIPHRRWKLKMEGVGMDASLKMRPC
jgi:hypothetical protein